MPFLNCFYSYDGGGAEVFSPNNIVTFQNNPNTLIFASSYETYTGDQGQGSIPVKGNDVTIRTSAHASTFYNLNNKDRFLWLNTNTDYENTSADLFSLVTAATSLIPSNNGANEFSATFTLPSSVYDYIYLIWDLRREDSSFLCEQAGQQTVSNLEEVCCACGCEDGSGNPISTEYTITNSGSTTLTLTYNGSSTLSILGNTVTDFCSSTTPTYTPTTASGVSITAKSCNC